MHTCFYFGVLMKKVICILFLSVFLASCASSGDSSLRSETESTVSSKIVEGKSTKSDVQKYFGSPDSVNFTDSGKEIWKYSFAKVSVDASSFIPFYSLFHNGAHGTKKELTILFDGDIVQKFTMAESAIDTKSGWAD